jgi:catechol 2,3-dioxygenase-like lactoylglutathione lyase family enzyme
MAPAYRAALRTTQRGPLFQLVQGGSVSAMLRTTLALLPLAFLAFPAASWPQIAPPNEAGISFCHLHPIAKDAEAEKNFWIAIGGTQVSSGRMSVIKFVGTLVLIQQGDTTAGSAGSVVDHAAFQVKDAKAAMAKWTEAGLKPATPFNASNQGAFLVSPAGIRVEFGENAALKDPVVFHHVQWATSDPAATQAWYVKTFGAVAGTRNNFLAADVPGANLTFDKAAAPTVGTKGRALDHIGFEVKDLAGFCKKLEAGGQKFDVPCNPRPGAAVSITYITDPFGTYIELTQGLTRY